VEERGPGWEYLRAGNHMDWESPSRHPGAQFRSDTSFPIPATARVVVSTPDSAQP